MFKVDVQCLPPPTCTAIASRGSSIFNFRVKSREKVNTIPATDPMIIEDQGLKSLHPAQDATIPINKHIPGVNYCC